MRIAVDGPSAAGKSTIAKLLSRELNITYIDTGAMYRAVALKVLRLGKRADNENDVLESLPSLNLRISHDENGQNVFLDEENVTDMIRTSEVAKGASDVSAFRDVRLKLVEMQREMAQGHDVVMDGRDIGTFVFPDAEYKFYLTASEEERARRRFNELKPGNESLTYEKCLEDLKLRDRNDSNREFAPLRKADDAVLIDSTNLQPLDVIKMIRDIIDA